MTHTPQDPIERLSGIVERFIDVSTKRMEQFEDRIGRQDHRIGRLEDAMLGFQSQMGVMTDVIRTHIQTSNERMDRVERKVETLTEGIERLEMLMENFIRQQQRRSTDNNDTDGLT